MTDQTRPAKEPSFLYLASRTLLRLGFAITAVLALLQIVTLLQQRTTYLELGLSPSLLTYLFVIAVITLILHSFAFLNLRNKSRPRLWLIWAAVLFALASFWYEYIFLRHPDQTLYPPWFAIAISLFALVLLGLFTFLWLRKEAQHGSGN